MRPVITVNVSRHEVQRRLFRDRMPNHVSYPSGLRRGRTANPQARVNALNGLSRVIIKLKIGGLFRYTRPKVDIRLIPDFEVPLHHLLAAITLYQMMCELINQFLPLGVVFGGRRKGTIPKIVPL